MKPKYGAKGPLAYLVHHGRAFKRELFDLIVRAGDRIVPVQQEIPIWDFAWHQNRGRVFQRTPKTSAEAHARRR